jgi:hypothetical protein
MKRCGMSRRVLTGEPAADKHRCSRRMGRKIYRKRIDLLIWQDLVRAKYLNKGIFTRCKPSPAHSHFWSGLVSINVSSIAVAKGCFRMVEKLCFVKTAGLVINRSVEVSRVFTICVTVITLQCMMFLLEVLSF